MAQGTSYNPGAAEDPETNPDLQHEDETPSATDETPEGETSAHVG